MKATKELYIIGPGMDKSKADINELKDKIILNFSGDLVWFNDNNIYPTYWSFLDPNSTSYIFTRLREGRYNHAWFNNLKNHTSLLFNAFQGTDLFYHNGFTTSRGAQWNKNEFGAKLLPTLGTFFQHTIKTPSIVLTDSYSSLYNKETEHLSPVIIHNVRGMNSDKLSCFILPLAISYFSELEHIHCIGFGDFSKPRLYNNSAAGYEGYKQSYQRVKNQLINLLKHKNINVTFSNPESYFNELTWKK